jgi:hypothetical protein
LKRNFRRPSPKIRETVHSDEKHLTEGKAALTQYPFSFNHVKLKGRAVMKQTSLSAVSQFSLAFLAVLIAAVGVGCAGGSVEPEAQYTKGESLPRPPVVLVYDFTVDPADVAVDKLGPNFVSGEAPTSERLKQGRAVAQALSEELVTELAKLGITAQRARDSTNIPMHALVIKGQFVSIEEGDQIGRVIVGFGAGGGGLQAHVQVFQKTETGLKPIVTAKGEAHGRKTPGVAGPAAVAAGAGMFVGLTVASTVTAGSELKGDMDTHVKDLAEEFAERAEIFYKGQGWL